MDYDEDQLLETFKSVLKIESKGIEQLRKSIDAKYIKLIEYCWNCKGKIILTGMGKSGHIARKISATLSSLGTASFFLHPAEAAHGDLGMVQKEDVVIMLSKSGNTDELVRLIPSLKIIDCKIIGLFCSKGSILENKCDFSIVLPMEKEACINNLAPTTSTTITLALGDALAVTLSKLKNFLPNDFAVYHPLGTLGKRLLTTAENLICSKISETEVFENVKVKEIFWTIAKNRMGAVVVVNKENQLLGLITDGDIRRAFEENNNLLNCCARDIMTKNPIVTEKKELAMDVFEKMKRNKISVIPIVEGNDFIGLLSIHDILQSGIV